MIINKRQTIEGFINTIKNKRLLCFGAGEMLRDAFKALKDNNLEYSELVLIDSDDRKWGQEIEILNKKIIINSYDYLESVHDENMVFLITSQSYNEIIEQIKSYDTYEKINCYIYSDLCANELLKTENKDSKFIIFNIPTHSNLGDHAIASAEVLFLQDNFDNDIIEVTREFYKKHRQGVIENIDKDDLIMFTGGGNIGTLWEQNNDILLMLLEDFPHNSILIFPQTIFYSDDEYGNKKFNDSIILYNKHKNLTICARDEKTYLLAKEAYVNCRVLLMPDMVMYMEGLKDNYKRNGIMICLKEDKESILSKDNKQDMKLIALDYNEYVFFSDTLAEDVVEPSLRDIYLKDKLKEFSTSKLVITDRLHGMIFAAITNTPCIALNNCNHKMKYTYKWLETLEYVKFADTIDEVEQYIKELLIDKEYKYNSLYLRSYFDKLNKRIKELLNE